MEAARDATDAARLLSDAAFRRACEGLHEMYASQWREASSLVEREIMFHRDAALTAVETELSKAVERGTFEEAEQTRRARRG